MLRRTKRTSISQAITTVKMQRQGILSVYLPPPISIHVSIKTFIQFQDSPESRGKVGVVEDINVEEGKLRIRHFLTISEVKAHLDDDNDLLNEVSIWPTDTARPPYYLCDSDILTEVSFSSVFGYAFVFYDTDTIVQQLYGMANTYLVTSYFRSSDMTIINGKTFKSFPSEYFPNLLPICHPLDLFNKILNLKRKIQERLNTRGKGKRNGQVVTVENFDSNAWAYVLKCCPVAVVKKCIVVKNVYLKDDDCILEKYREEQESFSLTDAHHLRYAQLLLGSMVGIGVRCMLRCRIGKLQCATTVHTIDRSERVNFVPFDEDCREILRRGFEFKYIPKRMYLTVTIRFRQLVNSTEVVESFASRLPGNDAAVDNTWPLHYTTTVFGSNIQSLNLQNQSVVLMNGTSHTVRDCVRSLEEEYY